MDEQHKQSKTLFIRNLPFSATNETLESTFADIGPIKQCFVVNEKGSLTCRGFGYVKFSLIEDAVKAKDNVKSFDGRKLFISFAAPKPKSERRKKPVANSDSDDNEDVAEEEVELEKEQSETSMKKIKKSPLTTKKTESPVKQNELPTKNPELTTQKSPSLTKKMVTSIKKSDHNAEEVEGETLLPNDKNWRSRSVVVTGFDSSQTKEKVESLFTCVKRLEHIEYPGTQVNNSAVVRLKSVKDAKVAIRKLQNKTVQGYKLTAVQLSDITTPDTQQSNKPARLIVRNLSFQCSNKHLEKAFIKFGKITEVNVPEKPDGKKCGFGFVQFVNVEIAQEAINQMNGKPIGGRPVAVDWAIPKNRFIAATKKDVKKDPVAVTSDEKKTVRQKETDSGHDSGSSDTKINKKGVVSGNEDDSSEEGLSDEDDGQDDCEDDDDSEEEDDVSTSEDEGFDDDDSNDDDDESEKKKGKKQKGKLKSSKTMKTDVDEGRTLFMRNVPFSSTDDELKTVLGEYGDVVYCKVVMDTKIKRPKGTAFVQFKTKEDADSCLAKAEDSSIEGGIVVSGRKLLVTCAVTKNKAEELTKKEKKKDKKDSRNLYLAREGLIRPGTQGAEGLSQTDIMKRSKVFSQMREKLNNPSIFVSSTRLSIHNLPTSLDDKQLKNIFINAVDDKKATLKECRIMRDMNRLNVKGVGKSRGYGFVEFTEHQHALKALQAVNNNPDLLRDHQRPIVHFSLENKQALAAKDRRVQRMQQRQESMKKVPGSTKAGDVRNRKTGKSEEVLQLKEQNKIARELYSGPKGLPKHFGPKVRHKPRENTESAAGKPREIRSQKRSIDREDTIREPAKKRRKRGKPEVRDNFDKLVNKYKTQILGAGSKRKWFDT